MRRDAQPKSGYRPTPEFEAFTRGFDICGQYRQEKEEKAQSGEGARLRNENADGSENLANSGEINQEHRTGERGGHHAGEVVTHFIEVGGAGEQEHDGQGEASRGCPTVEEGNAKGTESAE
ncbi:MAG: hypothetical protein WBL63_07380 [Candidatus Acidiferrum sp.]